MTEDLDTLSQRQQIEIICSNNYIKSRPELVYRGEGCEVLGIKIKVTAALLALVLNIFMRVFDSSERIGLFGIMKVKKKISK